MNLLTSTRSCGRSVGSMENCSTWNAWATETMINCARRKAIRRVFRTSNAPWRVRRQPGPRAARPPRSRAVNCCSRPRMPGRGWGLDSSMWSPVAEGAGFEPAKRLVAAYPLSRRGGAPGPRPPPPRDESPVPGGFFAFASRIIAAAEDGPQTREGRRNLVEYRGKQEWRACWRTACPTPHPELGDSPPPFGWPALRTDQVREEWGHAQNLAGRPCALHPRSALAVDAFTAFPFRSAEGPAPAGAAGQTR